MAPAVRHQRWWLPAECARNRGGKVKGSVEGAGGGVAAAPLWLGRWASAVLHKGGLEAAGVMAVGAGVGRWGMGQQGGWGVGSSQCVDCGAKGRGGELGGRSEVELAV